MVFAKQERRRTPDGSVICDNGVLRLRVVRESASLGLSLEANDRDGDWVALARTIPGEDVRYISATGQADTARFHTFEPVLIGGDTRGVRLSGQLGEMRIALTTLLSHTGTWCHHRIEFSGVDRIFCQQLTHAWELAIASDLAEIYWPPQPVYGTELVDHAAAFLQVGPHFVALVPDLEEGECSMLGMQVHAREQATIEYGIGMPDRRPLVAPAPARFAYTMCLDARAIPFYGFQQVVRLLGSHEAFPFVTLHDAMPVQGGLPSLPPVAESSYWRVFMREGAPAVITSLVHHYLALAEQGDWYALEEGLRWLDRLCLQQHIYEVPGTAPFGTIGNGNEWASTALWLPGLLLDAFHLTGSSEYAYRGIAALSTLPPAKQAMVLGHLHARFGDLYIHADCERVISLCGIDVRRSRFTTDGIELDFAYAGTARPLRMVVEGSEPRYTLTVNGCAMGVVAADVLRNGIELPTAPPA